MAVEINTDLCTGCGRCVEVCPAGAITIDESNHKAVIDTSRCTECGACIDTCKKGAIAFIPATGNNSKTFMQGGRAFSGRGGGGNQASWGQGRGRGGGSGSGRGAGCGNRQRPDMIGECYCPGCNISIPHRAGIPCSQTKCPNCGNPMIRK